MASWANYPETEPNNNNIVITTSQELNIPSNKQIEINLGISLITLPLNHIVKIINPQQNYQIIDNFVLPSYNELSLSVISTTPLHIKTGEVLCHLQVLPIQLFLPGNLPPPYKKNAIMFLFDFINEEFFAEFQLEPKKKIKYYGTYQKSG
jgi:hypothetical protein